MPTGKQFTLSIGIVTQGAPINDDAKLNTGSPVGLATSAPPSVSPDHLGAGPGQDNVTIASAEAAHILCAAKLFLFWGSC